MTSQGRNAALVAASAILAILAFVAVQDSCEFQHMGLLADTDLYGQTLDPDLCHSLNERAGGLNDRCEIQIEILDCG